jgi:hypothetical protein
MRVATSVLIIVALGWQFRWSTEHSPTFTAGNFFSYFVSRLESSSGAMAMRYEPRR